MADWIKIRSWHELKPGNMETWCGKPNLDDVAKDAAIGVTYKSFPQSEKTCETCFRNKSRAGG